MNKKDKDRYFKNNNLKNSIDFKISRMILGFNKKRLKYSISHKNGNAMVGFSKKSVGVDIEEMQERKNLKDLFFYFSTQEEQKIFLSLNNKQKLYFFYEIFTFKEALIKIKQSDFSIAQLNSIFEFNLAPATSPRIKTYHTQISFHRYTPLSNQYKRRQVSKNALEVHFLITTYNNAKYMICCIGEKEVFV